jgi:DNA-binding NarL/FixJ family response regulator
MPVGHARAERGAEVERKSTRGSVLPFHRPAVDKHESASERNRAGGGVLAHRVMVVDDHEIVRSGLVALITGHAGLEVTSAVATADEALRLLASGPAPQLVVADLILGKGLDGIQLTKGIKVHHPELPVLVLSGRDEALFAERALDAGASGYVMKDEAVERLFEALDATLAGHLWVSAAMRERLLPQVLSDRARQIEIESEDARAVIAELRRGNRTVIGIARALSRSHSDVERVIEQVRHHLQLPSRASLYLYVDTISG